MSILIKPIITEKMTAGSEKFNRYGFVVDKNATKLQIKKAVEDLYKVNVKSVNTVNYEGKTKTRYTKSTITVGKKNDFKKALVSVSKGQVIDFFSNI